MEHQNPYRAPAAKIVEDGGTEYAATTQVNQLMSGQKLVNYSIPIYVFGMIAQRIVTLPSVSQIMAFAGLGAFVMGLIGVLRIAKGLQYSIVKRVFVAIGLLMPLINLCVLVSLYSRANEKLGDFGYTVGFLGVKAPK